MPDKRLEEALNIAQQMDIQSEESRSGVDMEKLYRFLQIIKQIESSGGVDTDHALIPKGIHEGHRAIGSYGLMPNTIQEIGRRMDKEGTLTQEMDKFTHMQPEEMKQALESRPDVEQQFAEALGKKILGQHGDEEKAAYGWFQGHNISPERMKEEPYQDHFYTERYRNLKNKLSGNGE